MRQKKEATKDTKSEHWKKVTESTKQEIKKSNEQGILESMDEVSDGGSGKTNNKKHNETQQTLVDWTCWYE